jgi:hypothetical protein
MQNKIHTVNTSTHIRTPYTHYKTSTPYKASTPNKIIHTLQKHPHLTNTPIHNTKKTHTHITKNTQTIVNFSAVEYLQYKVRPKYMIIISPKNLILNLNLKLSQESSSFHLFYDFSSDSNVSRRFFLFTLSTTLHSLVSLHFHRTDIFIRLQYYYLRYIYLRQCGP